MPQTTTHAAEVTENKSARMNTFGKLAVTDALTGLGAYRRLLV